ncbi:MAG: NAD-dependent epimerase/dehydratase family protein [SAR202 cluster bacterium]|nr:NAD-dependent epimerase/dehydratase family protein [SAR202 cluster bacterium]|tara:strand:+ start:9465 stop:10475 length:1011 start_codon:yes stop_codon:yes gene_type:complete
MMEVTERIILGVVTGGNPYAEKLLQTLDKSQRYSKIVVICPKLNPIPIRNMITVKQAVGSPYYSVLRDHKVDVLVHLGDVGCSSLKEEGEEPNETPIVLVKTLIEACENSDINHLIYVSSACVYCPDKTSWRTLSEEDLELSIPERECDELIAEKLIQDYIFENPQIDMAILRTATVLGPSSDNDQIHESNFWRRISFVNSFPVQFTHEYDFIESIICSLINRASGIFNIASQGVVAPGEIAEIIGRKKWYLPKILPFIVTALIVRALTFHRLKYYEWSFLKYPTVLSTSKSAVMLGFVPGFSSSEAVVDYLYSSEVKDMNVEITNAEQSETLDTE